jgi:hypothetical protein
MSSPATTVSVTDKKPTGLKPEIRIVISVCFAVVIGVIALCWNGGIIPRPYNMSLWIGNLVFIPGIAVVFSLILNCIIQYLSCNQVTIESQISSLYMVPILFYLMAILLYVFPSLKWPIEGLAQSASPETRNGLSAGFYAMFMALYTQAYMNGISQKCPK